MQAVWHCLQWWGGMLPVFVLFHFFNPVLSFLLLMRGTSGQGIKSYWPAWAEKERLAS